MVFYYPIFRFKVALGIIPEPNDEGIYRGSCFVTGQSISLPRFRGSYTIEYNDGGTQL